MGVSSSIQITTISSKLDQTSLEMIYQTANLFLGFILYLMRHWKSLANSCKSLTMEYANSRSRICRKSAKWDTAEESNEYRCRLFIHTDLQLRLRLALARLSVLMLKKQALSHSVHCQNSSWILKWIFSNYYEKSLNTTRRDRNYGKHCEWNYSVYCFGIKYTRACSPRTVS